MDKRVITKNALETEKFGFAFAKNLKKGDLILLFGQLGAGKTTFTKGLAKGLGITDRILSPTFVLHRVHLIPREVSEKTGAEVFNHVDLYRIDGEHGLSSLGLNEILEDEENITVIEWAEKLKNIKYSGRVFKIMFNHIDESKREVIIEN